MGSKPLLHSCYLTSYAFLFSIRLLALCGKKIRLLWHVLFLRNPYWLWLLGAHRQVFFLCLLQKLNLSWQIYCSLSFPFPFSRVQKVCCFLVSAICSVHCHFSVIKVNSFETALHVTVLGLAESGVRNSCLPPSLHLMPPPLSPSCLFITFSCPETTTYPRSPSV